MKQLQRPKEKMTNDRYEVYLYDNFPESDLIAHYHEFYEIHMVLNGEVSYWIDGKVYPLNTGSLILLDPMQLHRPALTESASCQRIVLWINKQYMEQDLQAKDLHRCFHNEQHVYKAPHLMDMFRKLYDESRSPLFGSHIYAQSLILQILIEISRVENRLPHGEKSSPLMAKIISYVCDHYTEDLRLDHIAAHFHISKYHLSHIFKTETGTSLYRYIVLMRLAKAKELLQKGLPAGTVSTCCGFRDYSVFYKSFKAEYHQCPNDITSK